VETQYFYRIAHGNDTRIRVLMNDIPFYRRGPTEYTVTHTDGANHLVVPGDNVVSLELYEAPDNFHVIVEVTIDNDHEHPVVRIDWPTVLAGAPPVLPFVISVPFRTTGLSYQPAYLRAPRSSFGREGTHELRQAVTDFHGAMARNDADAFVRLVELKSAEFLAAYEGHSSFSLGDARRGVQEYFAENALARPLDLDEIVFEPRAEGRVAYVTRVDWGPAVEATTSQGRRFATDLWLTRHEGAWKIYR